MANRPSAEISDCLTLRRCESLGAYRIVERNLCHALAVRLITKPSCFWLSRTFSASVVLATSTHSPPFAPE
jgi:hypothetical protein